MVCVVKPLLHNHAVPLPAVKLTDPPEQNVVAPLAVIVAVGKAFTVTVVEEDVAEHPLALVTVTLYVPLVETAIVCDVAPLLHNQDDPAPAVKFTEPPVQNVAAPDALIVAVGKAFTVTMVDDDVAEQPAALVTVTL